MERLLTNLDDSDIFGSDKRHQTIFISKKYDVNPKSQSVHIQGEFKGLVDKNSILAFGICCYKDDQPIWSNYICRQSNISATIINVLDHGKYKNKKLIVSSRDTDTGEINWSTKNNNNHRLTDRKLTLGFYYDGNTNKIPDFVLYKHDDTSSCSIDDGAIREVDNHSITLNLEMPENIRNNIINGKTKVMHHTSGGTYNYAAANGVELIEEWTKFKGIIMGMAGLGERDDNKFWTDTNSFELVVLINANESDFGAETYIKNIKCEIISN